MRRNRGVVISDYDVELRYVPGEMPVSFRTRHHKEYGTAWTNIPMDAESFAEFRKQVNVAWHEYEKANPPPGPTPGEWEPVKKKTAAKKAAKK